jgi:DNA invertase Pin-like site-specific DNA recombinase
MLGVFAEFETNLRRERQLEGIAKAKAAGAYKGRPPSIEASRVRELRAQGMRPTNIARSAARRCIGCWRPAIEETPRGAASRGCVNYRCPPC